MDPATTELYTLSLHDALPICPRSESDGLHAGDVLQVAATAIAHAAEVGGDVAHSDRGSHQRLRQVYTPVNSTGAPWLASRDATWKPCSVATILTTARSPNARICRARRSML